MARNRKFRVKNTLTEVWLKLNFERAILRSVFHLDPEVKFENLEKHGIQQKRPIS